MPSETLPPEIMPNERLAEAEPRLVEGHEGAQQFALVVVGRLDHGQCPGLAEGEDGG